MSMAEYTNFEISAQRKAPAFFIMSQDTTSVMQQQSLQSGRRGFVMNGLACMLHIYLSTYVIILRDDDRISIDYNPPLLTPYVK